VISLSFFGQWACFPSERAFYRYAQRHLRTASPTLPQRMRRWLAGVRQIVETVCDKVHHTFFASVLL
jgi:hypothetical protein